MSQSTLKHKFKVQKVSYTADTDTTLNIKKRKDQIIYSGQTNRENVNLSFAQGSEINTANNLFVSDRSTFLEANRIVDLEADIFNGASFSSEIDTFLLTDIFTEETITQPAKPLFYQHLINRDRYDPNNPGHAIVSIEILDTDFKILTEITDVLVADTSYNDLGYGAIFNNLQNSFEERFSLPVVYYVKYAIRRGVLVFNYVELLNNIPVYREATFEDLDETSTLKSSRKTYILEESGSGDFTVTISRNTTHAVLQRTTARIKINKPSLRDTGTAWFVSISNGKFFSDLPNKSQPVKYEIAEFDSQTFSPYFPYKTVTQESAVSFESNLYKLAHQNITVDQGQGFNVLIEVRDADGETTHAFSTDPLLLNTAFNSDINYTDGLRSIDQLTGFIDIKTKLDKDNQVLVTYIYEEKEYEFTEVNFNPANNRDVVNETVVIYVLPQTTELERTLFYLRLDKSGKIIHSSQAEYGDAMGTDISTRMENGFYYNKESDLGEMSFIDRYTVESASITADTAMALILGEIYVGESSSIEDVTLIDIRIRGGGILPADRATIIQKNFESLWNWDIGYWDGYPYPGSASYMVEIPCETLTTASGVFSLQEARAIIEEHTALGVYPAIRTYGISPVVSGVNITTSGVTLDWTYHGPGVTYNIYMATAGAGPYTKQNPVEVAGVEYTISGLANGTHYWFFVSGSTEDGHECLDADDRYVVEIQTI